MVIGFDKSIFAGSGKSAIGFVGNFFLFFGGGGNLWNQRLWDNFFRGVYDIKIGAFLKTWPIGATNFINDQLG